MECKVFESLITLAIVIIAGLMIGVKIKNLTTKGEE